MPPTVVGASRASRRMDRRRETMQDLMDKGLVGGTALFLSERSRVEGSLQGLTSTRVGQFFMSQQNVEALQEAIRYRVFVESGNQYVIGRQSDSELGVVMRSILFQYGEGDDDDVSTADEARKSIVTRTMSLNARVLDFCVPKILKEADGYVRYTQDASKLSQPFEYGKASSQKATGSRSLELGSRL